MLVDIGRTRSSNEYNWLGRTPEKTSDDVFQWYLQKVPRVFKKAKDGKLKRLKDQFVLVSCSRISKAVITRGSVSFSILLYRTSAR